MSLFAAGRKNDEKKYNALWRAGENIGAALLLTAAMLVMRIVQIPGVTNTEIKMLTAAFFSASLLFVAGLIFCVNTLNWYFIEDAVRVTMGGTRKKIFMEMQITKLVSAAGVFAVVLPAVGEGLKAKDMQWIFWGFAALMILQAIAELAIMVWFRFRKMGVILMTAAAAVFGFCIAYGVMSFLENGVFWMHLNVGILMNSPVGSAVLLFVIYHVLVIVSWSLWERAEITL